MKFESVFIWKNSFEELLQIVKADRLGKSAAHARRKHLICEMLAFLRRAAPYHGRCNFFQRVKIDHLLCHYCAYHPWHVIVENDKRVVARLSRFD